MAIDRRSAALDDAAFTKLEAVCKRQLSPELRSKICDAIDEHAKLFAFSQCLSPDARRATEVLAKHGKKFHRALDHLRKTPAAVHALLYEEGTALAVFFHGAAAIDPHNRGNQILNELPRFLGTLELLVDGAARRMREVDTMKPKRRPADTHTNVLCRRLATIFEESGGTASISGNRSGPFARFLTELWQHLPPNLRPHSADAMVKRAQVAIRPVRKRQEDVRRAQDAQKVAGLDEAFARALKAHGIAD